MSLPKEEYDREIRVNNKKYKINVKWLLQLKNNILEEQSASELEETLEKISKYLDIFAMGLRTATLEIKRLEVKYEKWYSEKYMEAEEKLTTQYQKEVDENKRSITKATPTQSSIKSTLIKGNQKTYGQYKKKIESLRVEKSFLKREFDILQSRAMHIQSLLNLQKQILMKEM